MSPDKATRLTRDDLRNLDGEAKALVFRAQAHGWVGYVGRRGHVFMYAPDGESTMSVSRESLRGRSGRNMRARFDRWVREHPNPRGSAFGIPEPEEPIGLPELAPGITAPNAMAAEIRRHPVLRAFYAAGGDGAALHATAPLHRLNQEPRTWYAVNDGVDPPELIAHGSGITAEQAWQHYRDTNPEMFPTEEDETMTALITCADCGRTFDSVSKYNGHRRASHGSWPCRDCDAVFNNLGSLMAHRRDEHETEADRTCPVCGRVIGSRSALANHMRKWHPDGEAVEPAETAEPSTYAEPEVRAAVHTATLDEPVPTPLPEPTPLMPDVDPVMMHLSDLPTGEDAEAILAQVRAIVAAPLVGEIERLRRQRNELIHDNDVLRKRVDDAEARFAIMREAMGL